MTLPLGYSTKRRA
ncbi:hypothetical protein AWZ03_015201, partial [Drosophila navojoa]